jgi:hypothetical protein
MNEHNEEMISVIKCDKGTHTNKWKINITSERRENENKSLMNE